MREEVKAFVDVICGDNWENVSREDRNAGYGVACMQAYITGTKPTLYELSEYLEIPRNELRESFSRLLQSGMFSRAFNARGDRYLDLDSRKSKRSHNSSMKFCAWGYVGGIASGLVARNYSNMDIKAKT